MLNQKITSSFSSHHTCFICRKSYFRLHRVKQESIKYAYLNHRIYININARCCRIHLDPNGQIKKNEFSHIPTRPLYQKPEVVIMLNSFLEENLMFEPFKKMDVLDDFYCSEITGWSKKEFVKFSSFITSIRDTIGRTKEQLIALYRYWLRKGTDGLTLAKLFGKKTTQYQISRYLSQIREAIYKDFVPFYLGVQKRSRNFFLKHNSKTTHELYDFDKEILCIFADATYCRIEKSLNNQFQYFCWSDQKNDLLIKPFNINCADGWVIDCYGPFHANDNDAKIFDYILKTDESLKKILKPKKTAAFLDRG